MLRKTLSLALAAALCLGALPVGAQDFGPNTIWGEVPSGAEANGANAVLQDASGRVIASVPVIDGKFAFRDVTAGDYVVLIQDGAAKTLAQSEGVNLPSGAVAKVLFTTTRRVPAAVVPGGGGGLGTTGWVILGAAAVGITTAVVVATRGDEGTASPSR